jgi:hypothetical protein
LAALLTFDQFLALFSLAVILMTTGLLIRDHVSGEGCAQAGIALLALTVMGFFVSEPVTGMGYLVIAETLTVATIFGLWIHVFFQGERQPPQIEVRGYQVSTSLPHVTVVIPLAIENKGAPTPLKNWRAGIKWQSGRNTAFTEAALLAQKREMGNLPNLVFYREPIAGAPVGCICFEYDDIQLTPEDRVIQVWVACQDKLERPIHAESYVFP